MLLEKITQNSRSTWFFPLLAASSIFLNSGCEHSSKVDQPSQRQTAENMAKKTEAEERTRQIQADWQEYFISTLDKIDTEAEDKGVMYGELISLCKEASHYNCRQMLSFRTNVLAKFFSKLEQFALANLSGFKLPYDLPDTSSGDAEPSDWEEALKGNQLMLGIEAYCNRTKTN